MPKYSLNFNFLNTISDVAKFAIEFAHKSPSAFGNTNKATIVSIIVVIPRIKFEIEKIFIWLSPLASALLKFINMFEITNTIKANANEDGYFFV